MLNDEIPVSVGGVLIDLMLILLGVPEATPPFGSTGKLPEEITEVPPVSIAAAVPLVVAFPTIKGLFVTPPPCSSAIALP